MEKKIFIQSQAESPTLKLKPLKFLEIRDQEHYTNIGRMLNKILAESS